MEQSKSQRPRGVSVLVGTSCDPQLVRIHLRRPPCLSLRRSRSRRLFRCNRSLRGLTLRRRQLCSGFRQLPLQRARELQLTSQRSVRFRVIGLLTVRTQGVNLSQSQCMRGGARKLASLRVLPGSGASCRKVCVADSAQSQLVTFDRMPCVHKIAEHQAYVGVQTFSLAPCWTRVLLCAVSLLRSSLVALPSASNAATCASVGLPCSMHRQALRMHALPKRAHAATRC